ncbi:MAG: nitrate reductase [Pseudomonadota bacterium]
MASLDADKTVATTCPYCGVGCGIVVRPESEGGADIHGDETHPANRGRLCSKGAALGETLGTTDRLLAPRIAGRNADWDESIDLVARRFCEAIDSYGRESVALYLSGQLLTEDYYVANKLMNGYVGTANIDTNSRLCMASSVAGHRRAFGTDTVPGVYEDLEQADLVVLVGSNLAWCHPVLFQRLAGAKQARPALRVVSIDPRRTATSDLADVNLRLAPGSDIALFGGLLCAVAEADAIDTEYVGSHVSGLADTLAAASSMTLNSVAEATGLSTDTLAGFYENWVKTERVVTVYSQGVNQAVNGTDTVNAIINCHLATGRIGRPGMGPFSVTGQPNAMGGREVGGLSTMLTCHLELENAVHRQAVQDFWASPAIADRPGLKAVDLFDACAEGRIKALWIMCTNPVVSMPEADKVIAAIKACPFVIVSEIADDTDTSVLADVVLPATGWGEKSGTVTNSERCISRQRPFREPLGAARHDWKIISDVASAMGWSSAFNYESPAEIFREFAALSGVAASNGADFDISGLATITDAEYDALQPVHWPLSECRNGGRFFADGDFYTPDRKARMIAVNCKPPPSQTSPVYPLRLNTGRVRDHWHTMTRTAKSPRLSRHIAEPFAEIHPSDAKKYGIDEADLVTVENVSGSIVVRALITDSTPVGSIFVPIHWTNHWSGSARVDALVQGLVDPISGQPASKASAVRVSRLNACWFGFVVSRFELRPQTNYWARALLPNGCWQAEIADTCVPPDWAALTRELTGIQSDNVAHMEDLERGTARVAITDGGQISAVLFAARHPVEVARSYVVEAFANDASAFDILAGRPSQSDFDPGPIVCSCLNVGANLIRAKIDELHLTELNPTMAATGAGRVCGSCQPEIKKLLAEPLQKAKA